MTWSDKEQKSFEKVSLVISRVEWQLKVAGSWPFEKTLWSNIKFIIIVLFYVTHLILAYGDLIMVFSNIEKAVENFSSTGIQTIIFFRIITLKLNEKLHNLIAATIEDISENNYKDYHEKRLFIKYHIFSYKYFMIGSWFASGSAVCWYIKEIPGYIILRFTNETAVLPPPFRIFIPFDVTSINRILIVYICETPVIALSHLIILTSILYSLIVSNICAQLSLLSHRMKINLSDKNEYNLTLKRELFFKRHVDKHCQLLSIVNNMESVYFYQLVLELLQFTILLALAIYMFFMGNVIEVVTLGLSESPLLVYIFIPCYLGQRLINEVDNLRDTYYKCLSYNMSINNRKKLLICMIIGEKPLHITVGGFYIYTLNSFLMEKFEKAACVMERVKSSLKLPGVWPFEITFIGKVKFTLFVFYLSSHLAMGYADLITVFGDIEKTVENLSETGIHSAILLRMIYLKSSKKLHNLLTNTIDDINKNNYKDNEEKKLFSKYFLFFGKFFRYGTFFAMQATFFWYIKAVPGFINARLNNQTATLATPFRIRIFINFTPLYRILLLYIYEITMIYEKFEKAACVMERVKNSLELPGVWPFGITFMGKVKFTLFVFYLSSHLVMGYADLITIFGDIDKTVENLSETGIQSAFLLRIFFLKSRLNNQTATLATPLRIRIFINFTPLYRILLLYIYEITMIYVENLRESYYESLSYDLSIEDKKKLLICMIMVDKPVNIKAGGFYNYSLNSFLIKNFEIAKSVIERVKNQLKFIGIWPFGLTFLAKIRFSLLVFYHASHLMMGYADLISIFGDIEKTVENFSETNTQSSILIRILLLKLSKDLQILLATTLNHMNEENYRDDDEKRIFIKYYLLADKLLKYGIYFAMGSTIYWYVKGIPAYIDARLHNETAILATPYRLCTFIDITPLHRTLIIYVFELTMIYINNIGIYMLTLYTLIVLNMCVQLAILSHRIKIYFKDDHKNIRKENSFKYYVDKHSQLISMIQKINDIYYFQLFYELLSFTVLLGLLMYTGSESFNNDDIAGAIFIGCYICCMMIIIFCTCYLGECIHTEVDNLRDTYYQCLSYNLSMEDKKKLLICLSIADKPVNLTAGGFYIYSLHSFLMVLKTAMGYLSVLRSFLAV
ncbi:hypothetical protein HCN44_009596 [Aphidius gifuensis]|uniref:Odorant receptor n=1 Tax=Aphidius gifuensis TaxID=684658 RepID=A0A834Y6T1_APHGI|nr:hypothetical protein HCN44_009596 [Aphidius gifuensis]